jgi:hypothetical protein
MRRVTDGGRHVLFAGFCICRILISSIGREKKEYTVTGAQGERSVFTFLERMQTLIDPVDEKLAIS